MKYNFDNKPVFLDNASTTPMHEDVLSEMMPYFKEEFGNPSANNLHSLKPKFAIQKAREQVANILGCKSNQILFNSGSTEGINHVIKSSFFTGIQKGKNHLIISSIEHKAVLEVAEYIETLGANITKIKVNSDGIIDLQHLSDSITEKTFLVCIMLVNNETGVIQPVKEVVSISQEKNISVFTDATQAIGKIHVDVTDLGVDYLCLSAHKFNGPKGIGALYLKKANSLTPILHGGSQENGQRGGTYNVPGIVGLGKASELVYNELDIRIANSKNAKNEILNNIVGASGVENFKDSPKVDNIISISLTEHENDEYLIKKSHKFSASTGSACTAEVVQDSHVLRSIPGIEPKKVIRISI